MRPVPAESFTRGAKNVFTSAMIILAAVGCGAGSEESKNSLEAEITPEQAAEEFGLPNNPNARRVPSNEFHLYPLVIDIFRRSSTLPVLGEFLPEYTELLAHGDEVLARKKFAELARKEFGVVSLRNVPYKTQIVSGALEGIAEGGFRTTPPGNYRMDIRIIRKTVDLPDGTRGPRNVQFPWLRSAKFNNSQMYWALWMFGGYFLHSSPHYGEMGAPASMGCIRQTFPDSMELFKLRQEHPGMVRVHEIGSQSAYTRLRELTNVAWVLPRMAENVKQIRNYIAYAGTTEINVQGHAWLNSATGTPNAVEWPNCGPVDCFNIWDRKKP